MHLSELPWLGIAAATVVYFILGAVWYGAFAKPWMRYIGVTEEQMKEGAGPGPYLVAAAASFVGALATGVVLHATNSHHWQEGLHWGLLLGFGVAASAIAKHYAFQGHPAGLFAIDAGYDVLGFILMAVVIVLLS